MLNRFPSDPTKKANVAESSSFNRYQQLEFKPEEGSALYFKEETAADVFSLLKTTRDQFVAALLALKDDPSVRQILAPEITQALMASHLSLPDSNTAAWQQWLHCKTDFNNFVEKFCEIPADQYQPLELEFFISRLKSNENKTDLVETLTEKFNALLKAKSELENFCSSSEIFEFYLNTYREISAQTLLLYAKAKNISLHLLKQKDSKEKSLVSLGSYRSDSAEQVIYLLQKDQASGYVLLKTVDKLPANTSARRSTIITGSFKSDNEQVRQDNINDNNNARPELNKQKSRASMSRANLIQQDAVQYRMNSFGQINIREKFSKEEDNNHFEDEEANEQISVLKENIVATQTALGISTTTIEDAQLAKIYRELAHFEKIHLPNDIEQKLSQQIVPQLKIVIHRNKEICAFASTSGNVWIYKKKANSEKIKVWQLVYWKTSNPCLNAYKCNIEGTRNVSEVSYSLFTQHNHVGSPRIDAECFPDWNEYHLAAARNDVTMIDKGLAVKDAWLDVKTPAEGYTPLHISCMYNALEAAKLLLQNNADYTALDRLNRIPADNIRYNPDKFTQFVPHKDASNPHWPIFFVAVYETAKKMALDKLDVVPEGAFKYMLGYQDKLTAYLNETVPILHTNDNYEGLSALHYVAQQGNPVLLEVIIDVIEKHKIKIKSNNPENINMYSSVINLPDATGKTMLHHLMQQTHDYALAMLQLLLEHASELVLDLAAKDEKGETPLHVGIETINQYLKSNLNNSNDNNLVDSESSRQKKASFVEKMVECLIKVSQIKNPIALDISSTSHGNTALHLAVSYRLVAIVELLLAAGADPNVSNKYGRSPLHLAVKINPEQDERGLAIVKLLTECSRTDVNLNNKNDQYGEGTALHSVAETGYIQYAKMLLSAHADVSIKDKNDQTALMRAQEAEHDDMSNLLNEYAQNQLNQAVNESDSNNNNNSVQTDNSLVHAVYLAKDIYKKIKPNRFFASQENTLSQSISNVGGSLFKMNVDEVYSPITHSTAAKILRFARKDKNSDKNTVILRFTNDEIAKAFKEKIVQEFGQEAIVLATSQHTASSEEHTSSMQM